jgi:hypothetical protein
MGVPTHPSPTFPQYPGGAVVQATSDTALFSPSILYVGVTGNVRVLTSQGDDTTFTGVPSGSVIPVQVIKLFATNTTASSFVRIY